MPRARPELPTLKKVAAAAGVSASTVSRVYSHPQLLRPETVTRVRAVADELGYVPHHPARALKTGRIGAIAVVVPDIANPFFPPVIRAAEDRAHDRDIYTLLADTDEMTEKEVTLLVQLQRRTDGVVLVSSRLSTEAIRNRSTLHPLVLVNRDVEGVSRVLVDTAAGMREAVDHLADLAHRHVVYLAGPSSSWSDGQRRAAVLDRAQRRGVRVTVLGPHRPEHDEGMRAAAAVLETGATAVIAFDDVLAQGVLAGCAAAGVRIPQEMSLIGCDDILAVRTAPPLTTVRGPSRQAGALAVDFLLRLIDGVREETVERLPAPLVVRETTGPALA